MSRIAKRGLLASIAVFILCCLIVGPFFLGQNEEPHVVDVSSPNEWVPALHAGKEVRFVRRMRSDPAGRPAGQDVTDRAAKSERGLGPLEGKERAWVSRSLRRRATSRQRALDDYREGMDVSSAKDIDKEATLALRAARARAAVLAFESDSYYVVAEVRSFVEIPNAFVVNTGCLKDGKPATARIVVRYNSDTEVGQTEEYVSYLKTIRLNEAVLRFNSFPFQKRRSLIDRALELGKKSSRTAAEEAERASILENFPHGARIVKESATLRVRQTH